MAKKKSASRALTVYRPPPPPPRKTTTRIVVAQPAKPARRRSSRPRHVGRDVRKGVAIASVVLGYVSRNQAEALKKVPAVMGSRYITLAAGLHMLAEKRPGGYIDHAATAMVAIAGFNIGKAGSLSGAGALEGGDDETSW